MSSIDFYPRPPGGGRPSIGWRATARRTFLSTPSGWRATKPGPKISVQSVLFLSTPSGWRATSCSALICAATIGFLSTPSGWRATSISSKAFSRATDFYPRPPGGGRPCTPFVKSLPRVGFLSTPSGWRATSASVAHCASCVISIHALRVEGDLAAVVRAEHRHHFYPRPPGGGRPTNCTLTPTCCRFLSTPSGWRATSMPIMQR